MSILWSRPDWVSVREVHERLAVERDLAYTTVMTVLDRLAKKGLATRYLEGRAWLYRPARTEADEFSASLIQTLSKLEPTARREVLAVVNRTFAEPETVLQGEKSPSKNRPQM
ncbi:MAG: BlaI/MecI/CopY family transcriptional regulator [Propionicimonas sp.]|nr:BlaI/MecI/CopY family transcriptional regulator [Propionicimonas sp.]